jgi:hypothetical protein
MGSQHFSTLLLLLLPPRPFHYVQKHHQHSSTILRIILPASPPPLSPLPWQFKWNARLTVLFLYFDLHGLNTSGIEYMIWEGMGVIIHNTIGVVKMRLLEKVDGITEKEKARAEKGSEQDGIYSK